MIKENILRLLVDTALTHTELMEKLYQNVKNSFEADAQWYGEVIKLDLEVGKIIERICTKPAQYQLKTTKL